MVPDFCNNVHEVVDVGRVVGRGQMRHQFVSQLEVREWAGATEEIVVVNVLQESADVASVPLAFAPFVRIPLLAVSVGGWGRAVPTCACAQSFNTGRQQLLGILLGRTRLCAPSISRTQRARDNLENYRKVTAETGSHRKIRSG